MVRTAVVAGVGSGACETLLSSVLVLTMADVASVVDCIIDGRARELLSPSAGVLFSS